MLPLYCLCIPSATLQFFHAIIVQFEIAISVHFEVAIDIV